MAIKYQEGRSLGANLLADLQTAILGSTDWSRPNAGARPHTYKAVTLRGAEMVIDLADAAATVQRLQIGLYASYDGTTLGTKAPLRYLWFQRNGNGAFATNPYYWTLSCGKEHFFLSIEGPRPTEAGADNNTYGSTKGFVAMSDLVPYFDSTLDPTAAVVAIASPTNANATSQVTLDHKVIVSKSTDASVPWSMGSILTLDKASESAAAENVNRLSKDGNTYLGPWVLFDDIEGIRGRLSRFFSAGYTGGRPADTLTTQLAPGQIVTYNGIKYKLVMPHKGDPVQTTQRVSPFGSVQNWVSDVSRGPLIAVPFGEV